MASTRRKIVVRCMAAATVLVLMAAIGWWWVQWPVRTAEEFLSKNGPGTYYQRSPEGYLGGRVSFAKQDSFSIYEAQFGQVTEFVSNVEMLTTGLEWPPSPPP